MSKFISANLETDKSSPIKHQYDTRRKTKEMDQRLEKLKQLQREMQDQLQVQMQEQLAKIQQDMMDKMLQFQRNMMTQLTQLLAGRMDKGKSLRVNAGEDNVDPLCPLGFTLKNAQTCPQDVPISIRSQQCQVGTSTQWITR